MGAELQTFQESCNNFSIKSNPDKSVDDSEHSVYHLETSISLAIMLTYGFHIQV